MKWQNIDTAPREGEIILTDEGVCYWSEDKSLWLLCSPLWRDGKPDHIELICVEHGAFDVDPVIWIPHPLDPTDTGAKG